MEIILKATTDIEIIIKSYLEANASEILAEKINNGTKTMSGCVGYIRKKAQTSAVGNCACIEDKVVFGWAVHFFEEDSITEESKPERPKKEKTENKPKPEAKPIKAEKPVKPANDRQLSLFDLFD